jgi:dTDP-4-amino-4,6-dideoxygalactose transaminase
MSSKKKLNMDIVKFIQVRRSAWYVFSKEAGAFEGECASNFDVTFFIRFSNGLDTLCLILRVMEISPGFGVCAPSNDFIPALLVVVYKGVRQAQGSR